MFLTGALGSEIELHLHLSSVQLGILVADYFLFAAASSFGFKFLTDTRPPLKVMSYGLCTTSVGTLLIAIDARHFYLFLIWLAICGVAAGIIQPATNAFLSQEINQSKQGIAFGIKQSGTPASTLLGGLALPLIALTIGWEFAYALAFILSLLCLILILIKVVMGKSQSVIPISKSEMTLRVGQKFKTQMSGLTLVTVGIGLGSGTANTYGAFFVSSNIKAGFNPKFIGYLFAFSSVMNLITRVILGNKADRKHLNKYPMVLNWVAVMFLVGSIGYLLQMFHNIALITFGSLTAAILGWGWPGLTNLAVVRRFPEFAHRATGISQSGVFLGAMAGPMVFGILDSNVSTKLAWAVNCGLALLAGLTIFLGNKRLNEKGVN